MADYQYPDGVKGFQHVHLAAFEYGLPTVDNQRNESKRGTGLWNAYMYIPNELGDTVNASWTPETVSATAQSVNAMANKKGSIGASDLVSAAAGIGRDLFSAADKLAPGAVASFNNNAGAHAGTILRPNDVLVLSGVGNNSISFNWVMTPKNAVESENIKQLIRHFKNAARPKLAGEDSIWIEYPPLFDVFVRRAVSTGVSQSRKNANQDLFSYKNMVMESFSVTYGGGANEALFYADGSPVTVSLSVALKSIRPGYYAETSGERTG